MKSAPTTFGARCGAAWATAATSLYFWACVVYLVYTMQALAVDHCDVARPPSMVNTTLATPTGITDDPYSYSFYDYETPDPLCSEVGDSPINRQYVALAAVHLLSAFMYGAAWRGWLAAHAASAIGTASAAGKPYSPVATQHTASDLTPSRCASASAPR